jgi:hypothetical protein
MMDSTIKRPIFIVGSGRSGTSIVYRLLAGHRRLAWFSNYVLRFPSYPRLARLNAFYQTPFLVERLLNERWFPKPVEAYEIWDSFHPMKNSAASPPLTEKDTVAADIEGLQHFIANILRFSRRARFVNKNTRNVRRSRYLHAMFPDALFIHVIRDGRAVTNSLLNVHFWTTLSLWWADGKTPSELQREGADPVLIAARHWKLGVERMLQDKQHIPQGQYKEIRYEELMQDPSSELKRILVFCDLQWTRDFQAHVDTFSLESRNFKWTNRFTPEQIENIGAEVDPLLEKCGF